MPTRRVAVLFKPEPMDLRRRETLRGIARYAEAAGHWHLTLDPYADQREPGRCDGILAAPRKGRARSFAQCPIPIVAVTWGLLQQPLFRVVENRHVAGRRAARHLAERGCRTFAYLGFSRQPQSRIERQAFTLALRKLGLHVHKARTFVTYRSTRVRWDGVMASLGDWLERLGRPAGLLVAEPGLARAVADLALRRGIPIPGDLAIVAADNDTVLCTLDPPLTAVHSDYAEVGHRAAEALDRLMNGERRPGRNILIEPTLVPRLSTDRQRVDDPVVAQALLYIEQRCTEHFDWRVVETYGRERIGPSHVAAAVGLSQRVLGARFQRAGRRTILQEIILARVEFAKGQLEHSNSGIAAIAYHSGFGSTAAMLRAFHRHLGMSPIAWRRRHRRVTRGE